MLVVPFSEAKAVLAGCVDIAASAPDELTTQLGLVVGPDGVQMTIVVPIWRGLPVEGEARLKQFLKLHTPVANTVAVMSMGPR